VLAISFILNHWRYKIHLKSHPGRLLDSILHRANDALTTSLSTILDSALFLSLVLHIACWALLFESERSSGTERTVTGARFPGASIYNSALRQHSMAITICPCLSIISTPYLRKKIRRLGSRVFITILALVLSGIQVHRHASKVKGDIKFMPDMYNNIGDELYFQIQKTYGCMRVFVHDIIPSHGTWGDANLLLISWMIRLWAVLVAFLRLDVRPLRWMFSIIRVMASTSFGRRTLELSCMTIPTDKTQYASEKVCLKVQSCRTTYTKYFLQPPIRIQGILNFLVYVSLQAFPIFFLWKLYFMQQNIRSVIQPPTPATTLYPPFADFTKLLGLESDSWDSDHWGFGQLTALSLWVPALLDLFYILLCKHTILTNPGFEHDNQLIL
jgi:hypothetical protein